MDFDNPPADPLPELQRWLEQASETDLHNPYAMTLATTDPNGRPSARMVLLKGLDSQGAVFYTNRRSRKAVALAQQPRAALLGSYTCKSIKPIEDWSRCITAETIAQCNDRTKALLGAGYPYPAVMDALPGRSSEGTRSKEQPRAAE